MNPRKLLSVYSLLGLIMLAFSVSMIMSFNNLRVIASFKPVRFSRGGGGGSAECAIVDSYRICSTGQSRAFVTHLKKCLFSGSLLQYQAS